LSMRSFSRMGSALAVLDFTNFGSSLSVRGCSRFGSEVRFGHREFAYGGSAVMERHTYATFDDADGDNTVDNTIKRGRLNFYTDGVRSLSIHASDNFQYGGGTLHGMWFLDGNDLLPTSESGIPSDRRLKQDIRPLHRTLAEHAAARLEVGNPLQPEKVNLARSRRATASWVLRELRPVSFTFKNGPEAKHPSYGFIAQELKEVFPSMVVQDADEPMRVKHQDLLAVVVVAAQGLHDRLTQQEELLAESREELKSLRNKVEHFRQKDDQTTDAHASLPPESTPDKAQECAQRLESLEIAQRATDARVASLAAELEQVRSKGQ